MKAFLLTILACSLPIIYVLGYLPEKQHPSIDRVQLKYDPMFEIIVDKVSIFQFPLRAASVLSPDIAAAHHHVLWFRAIPERKNRNLPPMRSMPR